MALDSPANRLSKTPDLGFASRNLALTLLSEIQEKGAYANLYLPGALNESNLELRDRAFVTELVYGTLRMQLFYDQVIAKAAGRSLSQIDQIPLQILRLTAHQLLTLQTPPHAAVDSAVRLVVKNRHGSASGFINAISRRISERDSHEWLELLSASQDEILRLATEFAHPPWIVRAYIARLNDISRVREELAANNQNPKVTAVIYPGEQWSAATIAQSQESEWLPEARFVNGNPELLREIRAATAGIQDQGSYLVARVLSRVPTITTAPSQPSPTAPPPLWLDLCAGPGGKAALLSRWSKAQGGRFLALERSEHRAQLVRRACENIVIADSLVPPIRAGSAERILLDAPCSGLGALRRRPDARLRKRESDIAELVPLQRALLQSAEEMLAPGGILAYVTCSPMLEETSANREWALQQFPSLQLIDARPFFHDQSDGTRMELGESLDVQLWPGRHGTDAMYLALFRKMGTHSDIPLQM